MNDTTHATIAPQRPDLPAPYQNELQKERERVRGQVLDPRNLTQRSLLLIGGAGYIGSAVTPHLLASGYRVRCLDRLLYENDVAVLSFFGHPSYQFLGGDHVVPEDVERALDGVSDVVILAGLVGDPITKKYPEESNRINHDGMLRLLDLLDGRGLNKVVFVSTCSNYGLIEAGETADEAFPLRPLSLYAEAKVAMEEALLARKGAVDYHATTLRFATAFGLSPRMRFDLTISEFTRELFLGHELVIYDADTWRPYCHVQDFADIIERVLEAPLDRVSFEVFNAGGNVNNHTKRMLADEITRLVPGGRIAYQEGGSDPRNYLVDFTKMRRRLHFEPLWLVSDGIRELVGALEQGLFRDIQTRRNFYGNYEIDYPVP